MAELKKCPFCDGIAYSYKTKNLLGEMFWGIECESNECIVHTMIAEYPTEEKAIEAWNNRVTESEIRAKAIDTLKTNFRWHYENARRNGIEDSIDWADYFDLVAEEVKERE